MQIVTAGIRHESLACFRKAHEQTLKGHYFEAIELCDLAISLDDKNNAAYIAKSAALFRSGKLTAAIETIDAMLIRCPFEKFKAHTIKAYYLAGFGRFNDASLAWEVAKQQFKSVSPAQVWDGISSLQGKTILIERNLAAGQGTAILLSRALIDICKDANHVYFEVADGYDLDINKENITLVKERSIDARHVDLIFPYTDLQNYFFKHADRMAKLERYLKLSIQVATPIDYCQNRNLRIGICWRGSGAGGNPDRFMALSDLSCLFKLGAQIVSLQKMHFPSELSVLRKFDIEHYPLKLATWSSTAALIKTLDIVISVDTAIAHLSGALAVPLLLLLPKWPEWHFYGDPPIWYPNVHVYRQRISHDWTHPLRQLAIDLQIANHAGDNKPTR